MKFLLYLDGHQGLLTLTQLFKHTNSIVVAVPAGFDNSAIEQFCQYNGIAVLQRKRGEALEFERGKYECLLSSQFQFKILPEEYNRVAEALNIHSSVLPTYKGKNSDVWALINDEKLLGVTVHRLNDKFDGGEVVHIANVTINDDMSNMQIYQSVSDLLPELVDKIVDGSIFHSSPIQLGPDIFWRARTLTDSRICWQQPARKVFLFVRALGRDPIYAFGDYKGKRFYIKDSRYTDNNTSVLPGGVVEQEGNLYIACGDGKLLHIVDFYAESSNLVPGVYLQ
jgi:methionyl-tRNA formyltransferase